MGTRAANPNTTVQSLARVGLPSTRAGEQRRRAKLGFALVEAALNWAAWFVLLQLGQALSWDWFSGLLPIALFVAWTLSDPVGRRIDAVRGARWSAAFVVVGLSLAWVSGRGALGWVALALIACAWAQWSLFQQTARHRCCGVLNSPTRPVLVSWIGLLLAVWIAADSADWAQRWPMLLFLFAMWFLGSWFLGPTREPRRASHVPPTANDLLNSLMIVMMGSLLLLAQWCVSSGGSMTWMAILHGSLMLMVSTFDQSAGRTVRGDLSGGFMVSRLFVSALLLLPALWLYGAWMNWQSMALLMGCSALTMLLLQSVPVPRRSQALLRISAIPALIWIGYATPTGGPAVFSQTLMALAILLLGAVLLQAFLIRRSS